MTELTNPDRLYSRSEILSNPCPVPKAWGVYAWFFSQAPGVTPTDGCLVHDSKTLLYVGISPDKPGKPNSKSNISERIRCHYNHNAEGSTLRKTLGILLAEKSGYPLRRVGSGNRKTFTNLGEQFLDQWMEDNAFVCWVEHDEPWELEQTLLKTHSCPLNIQDNGGHAFHGQLRQLRKEANETARRLKIVSHEETSRR